MKKSVLIIGAGMEIGGIERSLLGLLDSIDYSKFNVDLFLLWHTGELMPYINENVCVLPEITQLSLINVPIVRLVKEGHLLIASVRLFSKVYGDLSARIKGTQTINTMLCKKVLTASINPFDKTYDFALGFYAPHYVLTDKVNAKVKIGWVHTDYLNVAEKPDVSFFLPMWAKLDYIACVSKGVKESFNKVYPSLKDKTITVENILATSTILKQAKEELENDMINDGSIKLLSVGRFCVAKAFDLIPEVCSRLIKNGYHFKWYLIGFGQDEELIRNRIREFSVEEYVIILGKKINPYPYMKSCDIYVQPSRYEGKAVTVTEAQILNKPVLITRYETSASQVDEGVDGHICDQGVAGIAKGVAYLIDHPEYRQHLIEGTKKKVYDNSSEVNKIWRLLPT